MEHLAEHDRVPGTTPALAPPTGSGAQPPLPVIEGYDVRDLLADGETTATYAAHHRATGARVDCTVLRSRAAAGDLNLVGQIMRETLAAMRIAHPGIAAIDQVGFARDGRLYVTTAHPPGRSVTELLRDEGPITARRAARLAIGVAEALEAAHAGGVVHGDLTPARVIVVAPSDDRPERVMVTGIGLGALRRGRATAGAPPQAELAYASPERIFGEPPDARSDVFSLASVVLHAVIGHAPPIVAAPGGERHLPTAPGTARRGGEPSLVHVLFRARAADPTDRYQSAADFRHALEAAIASGGEESEQGEPRSRFGPLQPAALGAAPPSPTVEAQPSPGSPLRLEPPWLADGEGVAAGNAEAPPDAGVGPTPPVHDESALVADAEGASPALPTAEATAAPPAIPEPVLLAPPAVVTAPPDAEAPAVESAELAPTEIPEPGGPEAVPAAEPVQPTVVEPFWATDAAPVPVASSEAALPVDLPAEIDPTAKGETTAAVTEEPASAEAMEPPAATGHEPALDATEELPAAYEPLADRDPLTPRAPIDHDEPRVVEVPIVYGVPFTFGRPTADAAPAAHDERVVWAEPEPDEHTDSAATPLAYGGVAPPAEPVVDAIGDAPTAAAPPADAPTADVGSRELESESQAEVAGSARPVVDEASSVDEELARTADAPSFAAAPPDALAAEEIETRPSVLQPVPPPTPVDDVFRAPTNDAPWSTVLAPRRPPAVHGALSDDWRAQLRVVAPTPGAATAQPGARPKSRAVGLTLAGVAGAAAVVAWSLFATVPTEPTTTGTGQVATEPPLSVRSGGTPDAARDGRSSARPSAAGARRSTVAAGVLVPAPESREREAPDAPSAGAARRAETPATTDNEPREIARRNAESDNDITDATSRRGTAAESGGDTDDAVATIPAAAVVPAAVVPAIVVPEITARAGAATGVGAVERSALDEVAVPLNPKSVDSALRPPERPPVDAATRAEIDAAVGRFAAALETRDVGALRRIYPKLTYNEREQWVAFFRNVKDLGATFATRDVAYVDGGIEAAVLGTLSYDRRDTRRHEERDVTFQVLLRRTDAGWTLRRVR